MPEHVYKQAYPEVLRALGAGDEVGEGHSDTGNEASPDKLLVEHADLQVAASVRCRHNVLVPLGVCTRERGKG